MSVAMRSSAPGAITRASSRSVAADTSRRFWWRFFGQGSGNRMNARPDAGLGQPAQHGAGIVGVQPDVGDLAAPRWRAAPSRRRPGTARSRSGRRRGSARPARADARRRRSRSPATPRAPAGANSSPSGAGGGSDKVQDDIGQQLLEQGRLPRARLAPAPAAVAAQVSAVVALVHDLPCPENESGRLGDRFVMHRTGGRGLRPSPTSACRPGRCAPRRSRRPCPARGRNGRRPRCAHRSAC